MNVVIKIVLILLGLYFIFIIAPTFVMFRSIFGRQVGEAYIDRDLTGTPLEPHRQKLEEDFAYFASAPRESLTVTAYDGTKLYGELYGENRSEIVVCVHGYHSIPQNSYCSIGRTLIEKGYGVLFVYQRGSGLSGGKHTTFGVRERFDMISWTDELTDRYSAVKLYLMGASMGCASLAYASELIKNPGVKALILMCGFVSPHAQLRRDCVKRHLPVDLLLPLIDLEAKIFLRINIKAKTTDALEKNNIPVLFIHGTDDQTVPYSDTIENYEHCHAEKRLCEVKGADHCNLFLINNQACEAVLQILKEKGERYE